MITILYILCLINRFLFVSIKSSILLWVLFSTNISHTYHHLKEKKNDIIYFDSFAWKIIHLENYHTYITYDYYYISISFCKIQKKINKCNMNSILLLFFVYISNGLEWNAKKIITTMYVVERFLNSFMLLSNIKYVILCILMMWHHNILLHIHLNGFRDS